MGWYHHPDTMCIAKAQEHVRRKCGDAFVAENSFESLNYQKEFRTAYAEHCNYSDLQGFEEYLAELDEDIKFLEEGKTLAEIEKIKRDRFMKRISRKKS